MSDHPLFFEFHQLYPREVVLAELETAEEALEFYKAELLKRGRKHKQQVWEAMAILHRLYEAELYALEGYDNFKAWADSEEPLGWRGSSAHQYLKIWTVFIMELGLQKTALWKPLMAVRSYTSLYYIAADWDDGQRGSVSYTACDMARLESLLYDASALSANDFKTRLLELRGALQSDTEDPSPKLEDTSQMEGVAGDAPLRFIREGVAYEMLQDPQETIFKGIPLERPVRITIETL